MANRFIRIAFSKRYAAARSTELGLEPRGPGA
jgi:hypothetical protein